MRGNRISKITERYSSGTLSQCPIAPLKNVFTMSTIEIEYAPIQSDTTHSAKRIATSAAHSPKIRCGVRGRIPHILYSRRLKSSHRPQRARTRLDEAVAPAIRLKLPSQ